MKHLGFSAGGTRLAGLLGAAKAVKLRKYKPDIISGVSAGSIAALLYATDNLVNGLDLCRNLKYKSLLSFKPTSFLGISNGLLRLLFLNKKSYSSFANLRNSITNIITEKVFNDYKANPNSPLVYVSAVCIDDGSKIAWNLKNFEYEEAIDRVLASCSIPILYPSIEIDSKRYNDGGLRDFVASNEILKMHQIEESITIYTKPFNNNIVKSPADKLGKIIENTFDILLTELAKDDQEREVRMCIRESIKLTQIHLPSITNGMLDVNNYRLNELINESYKRAVLCIQSNN